MNEKPKNWFKSAVSLLSKGLNAKTNEDELNINNDIAKQAKNKIILNWNFVQNKLHELITSANYSNITVTNSSNVHLGNNLNCNGDLSLCIPSTSNDVLLIRCGKRNEVLINTGSDTYILTCHIIPRSVWSILHPKSKYDNIEEPVKLVIISHTATTSSIRQEENVELLRDIQAYHVETNGWNDIAYNFLIGCDGNIYEGRGWGFEGAHTFGYNSRSLGIAFIGCFIDKLPTEEALNACKSLLLRGINEGHLSKNYKLLGHRQCSSTESPGKRLYEEISEWDNFYNKSFDEDLRADENEE